VGESDYQTTFRIGIASRVRVSRVEQAIFYSLTCKLVSLPSAVVNRFHDDRFPGLDSMVYFVASSILMETDMSFTDESPVRLLEVIGDLIVAYG
jgi:hypothetical protein